MFNVEMNSKILQQYLNANRDKNKNNNNGASQLSDRIGKNKSSEASSAPNAPRDEL